MYVLQDIPPCDEEQRLCNSQVRRFGLTRLVNYDDISMVMRQRAIQMYGLKV